MTRTDINADHSRMVKQLQQANAWIQREVDQIAEIQRSLLPEGVPQIPGLEIAAHYETFDRAGGDLYAFISDPDQKDDPDRTRGILVADAAGHGPAAAVITAMLHTMVHTYPKHPDGPAEVLEYANHHLAAKHIVGTFVTAVFAFYNPLDRTLQFCCAGHPPPVLKLSPGSGNDVTRLDQASHLPLGIVEHVGYKDASITLQSGQTVVLYTDGITEANGPNGKMFGIEGIESAVQGCTGEPDCIVNSISDALKAHQAGERPNDDQTIVVIKQV